MLHTSCSYGLSPTLDMTFTLSGREVLGPRASAYRRVIRRVIGNPNVIESELQWFPVKLQG